MPELAYFQGQFLPRSDVRLEVSDLGLVAGAAVTEMFRTFKLRPFAVDAHVARLRLGLQYLHVAADAFLAELPEILDRLCAHNAAHLPANRELGLVAFVTAGHNLTYLGGAAAEAARQPTCVVHSFALAPELYASRMQQGQALGIATIPAMPAQVLDPTIKFRNRLHWYLADHEVRQRWPGALALLLDSAGHITETSAGNLVVVKDDQLLTPPRSTVLPGISLGYVEQLAHELGFGFREQSLAVTDLESADELLMTSTPLCLVPVSSLDGRRIGHRDVWGPVAKALADRWSSQVGVDIRRQFE